MATGVDVFGLILNYIFSPIGLVLITILAGIFIYAKYYAGKEKGYKTQKLDKTIQRDMKDIIQTTGIAQKKRLLRVGFIIIGKIESLSKVLYYPEKDKFIPKTEEKGRKVKKILERQTTERKGDETPIEFIEIQTIPIGIIWELLKYFGIGFKYFLIEKEFCNDVEMNQDIIISENTQFWRVAGINVFSDAGRKFVETIAFKNIYSQILESELNYIPRLTFLEIAQGKLSEKAKLFTDLRKKYWEGQVEELAESEE